MGHRARLLVGLPLSLITIAVAVICPWLVLAPRSIDVAVAGGELRVTTGAAPLRSTRVVALEAIEEVRPVVLEGGRRVAGTALPGYCVGRFTYRSLGPVWQASDCSRRAVLVVVHDQERGLLLTPADRGAFLAAVETGRSYTAPALRPRPGAQTRLMALLMVPLMVLALVVPVMFFVAPSRLRYRVVPGGVEITTTLRTRRLPAHGMRAGPARPRVGARLMGAAFPGYYAGWFMVDGRRGRVYATRITEPGVMLTPADGARVFINPTEPERFLAALTDVGVEVVTE